VDLAPGILARLERLAAVRIKLLPVPQIATHFVFERDGYLALADRREGGFGSVGSPGRMTENGFAPLVERAAGPVFLAKGHEEPASSEEAAAARAFLADLKSALA
jgi:hypothetical protein